MTRRTAARIATTAVTVAGLVVTVAPTTGAAPNKKVFHEALAVAGASAATLAPSTTYGFTFTLTNDRRSPQAFGSAEIVVPVGYTVGTVVAASDSTGTTFSASAAGGVILVTSSGPTGAGVTPGGTLTVTAAVTTPSGPSCDATWSTYVKQSNDFSGEGNDFLPADPAPTTTVGTDHLVFTRQPVTTEYDTAMTPGPQVTLKDPCGDVVTSYTGTVSLTDANGWLATGGSVAAVGGVATFGNLTFGDYGDTDTLTASATGVTAVTSNGFDVVQSLVHCAANHGCGTGNLDDGHVNGGPVTTIVSITADSGPDADTLLTSVKGANDGGDFPACDASGEPPLGTIVTFDIATRSKTVTMTLPRDYVNLIPNNGTPFMDICLSLPAGQTFRDKDGDLVSEGLLPDCSATVTTSCVTDRRKRAGDELITFKLPSGDPKTSWY